MATNRIVGHDHTNPRATSYASDVEVPPGANSGALHGPYLEALALDAQFNEAFARVAPQISKDVHDLILDRFYKLSLRHLGGQMHVDAVTRSQFRDAARVYAGRALEMMTDLEGEFLCWNGPAAEAFGVSQVQQVETADC